MDGWAFEQRLPDLPNLPDRALVLLRAEGLAGWGEAVPNPISFSPLSAAIVPRPIHHTSIIPPTDSCKA